MGDEGVSIGVTTDEFANLRRERRVLPYPERLADLEAFLTDRGFSTRAQVRPIETPEGFALEPEFNAIAVTHGTVATAEVINQKRHSLGLAPLQIVLAEYVLADDGQVISSTRIRNGEIDVEGHILVATKPSAGSRPRRFVEALALVAVWMALGYALRAAANLYLVLGIPLTLAFQLLVRRKRLEELWVRHGRSFGKRWIAVLVAAAAIVAVLLAGPGSVASALWLGAAFVGIFGAIYSIRNATKETVRAGGLCLASAGSIGVLIVVLTAIFGDVSQRGLSSRVVVGVAYLPLYFMVSFVLEEVSFRGAIDSHVHSPEDSHGLVSAIFVSAVWGLWHLPIAHGPLATSTLQLLAVHVPVGTLLSLFWRRSGSLAVPSFTHAFIDAVRNALLA